MKIKDRPIEDFQNAPEYLTRLLGFLGQNYYLVNELTNSDKWLYMEKLITGSWHGKKIKLEITPEGIQLIYYLETKFKMEEFIPEFSRKKEYTFGENHREAAKKMLDFLSF